MTVKLGLADAGEVADLAAFLARLIHYDRSAAVRLQAGGGALAVFGRPPAFEVLAIRTVRLDAVVELDVTVSAGELLEALDEPASAVVVPPSVTGPPWAGVLPPRGGWSRLPGLPSASEIRDVVGAAVAEFRARDEALPEESRTRAERDRIGREIWSRTLGATEVPLRVVHAAQSLGFLRGGPGPGPGPGAGSGGELALLGAGPWLRLRTAYGSVAVRRVGAGALPLSPL
ncbi:hypothetical protein ACFWBX_18990 [Streptomyces sp. NPDC059991]|uniref:hypothetical protein n=1 Tax=Streptomyces sp. NPDC059991 TaxID=3347028 RepID=UPI003696427D